MRIRNVGNPALTYDDVLLVPKHSKVESRSQVWGDKPINYIMSSNMDTITEKDMVLGLASVGAHGVLHRNYPINKVREVWKELAPHPLKLNVSVGSLKADKDRIDELLELFGESDWTVRIFVEMAHAHSDHCADTIKYIRDKNFAGFIVAGNVATPEGCEFLENAGADEIKVGIGPGSACTTRIKTGCGYPQLQAVIDCAPYFQIIADGGIKHPGDVAKALAAGAEKVMIGGMLAGTDLTPGWHENGVQEFRGMASSAAKQAAYKDNRDIEGISTTVMCKPKGSTLRVIQDIHEGLCSAMSYVGAANLYEFRTRAEFVIVSDSAKRENLPHIIL